MLNLELDTQELVNQYFKFLPMQEWTLDHPVLYRPHMVLCTCRACPSACIQHPFINLLLDFRLVEPHVENESDRVIKNAWFDLANNASFVRKTWAA